MKALTRLQKNLLGQLFDLMEKLKLEVDEARILRKTLGYSQEELKSLTGDIGKQAEAIRNEEDAAIKEGVQEEAISQMENFFKLGKVIHPDGFIPPKKSGL